MLPCNQKEEVCAMKNIKMIMGTLLILAGVASAAFQYEVIVADQHNQGNTVSGRDFFVRVTQGSGTLYLLDHINTLYSDHQTQAIANHVSGFGYYNLTTGESGTGSFDDTIIPYQQAMNPHNPVVTQTGYAIGTFREGDEIAIWITDNNGVTGSSVGDRGEPFVDVEQNFRNWGQQTDRLGNPAGHFSFSGSSAIFFGLAGAEAPITGVPLPGAVAVLLIGGGSFGAWKWMRTRKVAAAG